MRAMGRAGLWARGRGAQGSRALERADLGGSVPWRTRNSVRDSKGARGPWKFEAIGPGGMQAICHAVLKAFGPRGAQALGQSGAVANGPWAILALGLACLGACGP